MKKTRVANLANLSSFLDFPQTGPQEYAGWTSFVSDAFPAKVTLLVSWAIFFVS